MRKSRPSYQELLEHPLWKKKRDKIVKRAENRCQICASSQKPLHVHHSYYMRGKKPWQYPDGSLICICQKCHKGIHALKEFKLAGKGINDRWKYETYEDHLEAMTPEERTEHAKSIVPADQVADRFGSIFAAIGRVGQ